MKNFENGYVNGLDFVCKNNAENLVKYSINKGEQCMTSKRHLFGSCLTAIDSKLENDDYSFFSTAEDCR